MNNNLPAIAIIPYRKWKTFNLSNLSLDELEWPLGRPDRLTNGFIKDLTAKDHLVTFPRKVVFFLPRPKVKANISVMIVEPDTIHQKYLSWSHWLSWRFYRVLTKNQALLSHISNGEFYYFGSTFIANQSQLDRKKIKMSSLIASKKNDLKGHKLRHRIVKQIKSKELDVDIMGRAYKPFDNKEDGLAPYYYSVVIENNQERDYFTEKVIDACLCDTVPIYWGCPNIEDYLDARGMIICQSEEEIIEALLTMKSSDYKSRIKWIKKNRELALNHANYFKRAALVIKKTLNK